MAASAQRFPVARQTTFTNIPFSALQEFTVLPNSFLYVVSPGKVLNTVYFKNEEVIKMTTKSRLRMPLLMIALFVFIAAPAQSPNTATMIVVVFDQTGAVVKDAKVSVVNTATGAAREAVSGSDGGATVPALSLTGTYTVSVSKEGFGAQELKDVALRSGETATLN